MYCENEADEARESECGSGRSQVGVGQWRYGPSAPSEDQDPIPANNSCSMDQNRNNLLFASSSTHSIPSCRPWPDTALLLIIIHLCVKMSSSRRPFEAISKTPVCTIKTIFLPFEPHLRSWILGHHVYYENVFLGVEEWEGYLFQEQLAELLSTIIYSYPISSVHDL